MAVVSIASAKGGRCHCRPSLSIALGALALH
jgi:hypothetical protein